MHGAPARNVSWRKGPRPETRRRDLLGRDRDETRDAQLRDRNENDMLSTFSETRPRRDVSTSRDGLENETSRPRPSPVSGEKDKKLSYRLETARLLSIPVIT